MELRTASSAFVSGPVMVQGSVNSKRPPTLSRRAQAAMTRGRSGRWLMASIQVMASKVASLNGNDRAASETRNSARSAKPFSVGWWAIVSDDYYVPRAEGGPDRLLPRGALVRYREWYGAFGPNVGLKMTAEAVGAGIAQRESRDPNLRYGVLDPACFREDGGPSIAERINKELLAARLRPFHAADNARVPQRGSMGAGINYAPAWSAKMAGP